MGRKARGQRKRRQVIARHGYHCWYCGVFVMPLAEIPKGFRLHVTTRRIYWYDPISELVESAMAMTVDHIVSAYNGGTDEISNLVPACTTCNKLKGKLENQNQERKAKFCRVCGEASSMRRLCSECHEKNKAAWFARATD